MRDRQVAGGPGPRPKHGDVSPALSVTQCDGELRFAASSAKPRIVLNCKPDHALGQNRSAQVVDGAAADWIACARSAPARSRGKGRPRQVEQGGIAGSITRIQPSS